MQITFEAFCFLGYKQRHFWKGIYSKRTDCAPILSKCFPFRVNSFSEGTWWAGKLHYSFLWRIGKIIIKTRLFKYIKNFTTKNWKFSDKNSDISHISAQNIYCGYTLEPPSRGGSNQYPQSMFLSRNKKNNVNPCKAQFNYIKWSLRGSALCRNVFMMIFF